METIWWVFKELYNKGLIYQGVKVMPFSTACNTPLSNFESGQNYKEVVDPAVVVSFPVEGGMSLLAWTTTPWTLPSNLACCVNPTLTYIKIKDKATGNVYVLMECRLEAIFKQTDQYEILEKFLGSKLQGLSYTPLFPYFNHLAEKGAFRVLADSYVTEDSGTGIVHQAPYFGEDDYRVCLAAGVITRDQEIVCPVDASGKFVDPVVDFKDMYVKDADKHIINYLKKSGRLVQAGQTKHSYPFCWRSDTPLIYKAVPSWFVRVQHMTRELLECSAQTYWVPDFVKEKRFGNWLRDARDWAISRNRYWGTPIPLWVSDDGEEMVCIGSIEELQRLTGATVTDLHRESIDHLEIPSNRPGKGPLKRIPEVFDCWFESGSMPYAQQHYPFENRKVFEDCFPADFIAEGIDQTRGWFYTLLVISTALFRKPPYLNLIANGLVLASDGQKMSKRKKNYPDPMEVVNKYGADALRLYLINSPVVRAENLRFKEEGVRDVIKDVFLPWYNAFRFLMQNVDRIVQEDGVNYLYDDKNLTSVNKDSNIMDCWILSFTESLLKFVKKEMTAYRLYTVVPRLTKFIDHLTNWYVRMNRKRLKGEGGVKDCTDALNTLFSVLLTMINMMAPFTPFLSEFMYQHLSKLSTLQQHESVHYLMLREPNDKLIQINVERAVSRMQAVIELGRVLRDRKTIPVKYPLPELIVIHQNPEYLADVKSLETYVLDELNIKKITLSTDKEKYGVSLRAEPDHKTLGARLKNDFKAVTQAIKSLTDSQLQEFAKKGSMTLLGHELELNEVRLIINISSAASTSDKFEAHSDNDVLILLDVTPDDAMLDEGIAREIINRIQKLRKKAHLVPTDEVDVYFAIDDINSALQRIAISHKSFIENTTKTPFISLKELDSSKTIIIKDVQDLKGTKLTLVITKRVDTCSKPVVPWVNVHLDKIKPRYGLPENAADGLILLESSKGQQLTLDSLREQVIRLFGLYGLQFKLWLSEDKELSDTDMKDLNTKTIIASTDKPSSFISNPSPVCPTVNITSKQKEATVILQNPNGVSTFNDLQLQTHVANIFQVDSSKIKITHTHETSVTILS